jgi:dTDP-D-glucose 4,6-dehydratase
MRRFGEPEEIANMVGEIMGYDKIKILIDTARLRPLDVNRLYCNYFKLHQLIGWKPKTNIDEGLRRTVEWFKENGGKWSWEERTPIDRVWRKNNNQNTDVLQQRQQSGLK